MKKKSIKNLIIATSTILGASYVIYRHMNNKKNKDQFISINAGGEEDSQPTYVVLGSTYVEDGQLVTRSICDAPCRKK